MVEHSFSPEQEKLEHIKKYYELLFSANNRIRQQAFTIRGWCLTLLIAYTGFVISRSDILFILIIPALFIPVFFCLLEGFLELNCSRVKEHMKEIDEILGNKNEQKSLYDKVKEYSFPSSYKREPCLSQNFKEYKSALRKANHIWTWYIAIFLFYYIILYVFLLNVLISHLLR